MLILVTGSIAAGKSTVSEALGARMRKAGRSVAVLDLDDVVLSIGGWRDLSFERFDQCFEVFGQLVTAWLQRGADVIAHGPIFERNGRKVLERIAERWEPTYRVTLTTTYDVALRRVQGDPERELSKEPKRLSEAYHQFESLLAKLPASDWSFDTTNVGADLVVDELAEAILTSHPTPHDRGDRHQSPM